MKDTGRADSSKPPVLFLAYYYPPQNASGAQRPHRFAKYLREFGYESHVLSWAAGGVAGRNGNVQEIPESAGGLAYLAARLAQRLLNRRGDRMGWVSPAVGAAEEWLREHRRAFLFSTFPPAGTHYAAWLLRRRYNGVRWVADFRDPMSGSAFRTGLLSRHLDKRLERAIVSRADLILVNTEPAEVELRTRHPDAKDRIVTLWNGFDPAEPFGPEPPAPESLNTVVHIGDLYGPRHPAILLASIARLLESGHLKPGQLKLNFIGPLDDRSPLRADPLFARFRLQGLLECNERLVPKAEAMQAIARAPRLLLLDLTGRERNVQVPAKLFDYVRAGRPVVAVTTPDSPAERILSRSGVRHACIHTTDSAAEVDRKLLEFLSLPIDPATPSEWFREQFDARAQAGTLAGLLDRLEPQNEQR